MKCIYCGKEIANGSMCEECSKNNSLNHLDNGVVVNNTDNRNHNKEKGTPFFRKEAKYSLLMCIASLACCYMVPIFAFSAFFSNSETISCVIYSIIDLAFASHIAARKNKYEIFYFILFTFMVNYFPIINNLYAWSHMLLLSDGILSTDLLSQFIRIDSVLHLSVFLGIGLGLLTSKKSNTISTNKVYYCEHCGSPLDNFEYCSKCGNKVNYKIPKDGINNQVIKENNTISTNKVYYCEYCGSPLDNFEYCSKCGNKVNYKIPEDGINNQNKKDDTKSHKILTYFNNNIAFPLIIFAIFNCLMLGIYRTLSDMLISNGIGETLIMNKGTILSNGILIATFIINAILAYYMGRYANKHSLICYIILNIISFPFLQMFPIYSNTFIEEFYLFNEAYLHIGTIIGILIGVLFKKFGNHPNNNLEKMSKKEVIANLSLLIIPIAITIISYIGQINYFNTVNDIIPDDYVVAFHSYYNENGISHSTYIYDAGDNNYIYIDTRNIKHIVNGREEENKMITWQDKVAYSTIPCDTKAFWNGSDDYFVVKGSSIKYPFSSYASVFHYFDEVE